MSTLEFLDYLHGHDETRNLAWDLLHLLRARMVVAETLRRSA